MFNQLPLIFSYDSRIKQFIPPKFFKHLSSLFFCSLIKYNVLQINKLINTFDLLITNFLKINKKIILTTSGLETGNEFVNASKTQRIATINPIDRILEVLFSGKTLKI